MSVPKYYVISVLGVNRTRNLQVRNTRSNHKATSTHEKMKKKLNIINFFGIFVEQNPKWKIPAYLPNYFSGQKAVQEKYLNMVVKIKSGLLAEKKPAYGRIQKIPANNCFKFGK